MFVQSTIRSLTLLQIMKQYIPSGKIQISHLNNTSGNRYGPAAISIREKIVINFPDLVHFEIFNDSYKHAGHRGMENMSNNSESHLRLVIVSNKFGTMNQLTRHRFIHKILSEDMDKYKIHALQLTTNTVAEWRKK